MNVIINDFSLDGQFNDMEVFIDSLFDNTIPMLDILDSLEIQILSSYAIYDLKVTEDTTLYDIIKIKGVPEITKFKKQLNELFFDEPFWEAEPLSDNDSTYENNFSNKVRSYCLAEALERDNPVLSFEHDDFKDSTIVIKKDGADSKINNLYNKKTLIEIFREIGIIDSLKYLLLKHNLKYSFGLSLGKNYFKDLCEETHLKEADINIIVNDINRLIDFTCKDLNPGRLSKPIDGKLKEFRTSLSDSKEIRIFYFEVQRRIVFLNGFLKKTQQTPKNEIDKAKILMDKLK
ncbi:type II toxin-antitoxin system RelE/ParE family toxin [Clostridium algidicarnis]|uniref:type II toxin-antitoxin system RelE/ParE family toxin n=1 Tax=Clostridium algidicarnis TaxID=37659 RepID=UPI001CF3B99C|nr:type II toxin-antitoxin system RelE/ParE family toxin [Clostridium algidicarnis]MCB2287638.1 type II toxin-antitoxin system RelE/ParE family toxin [Clostridium algidicarnis]